MFSTALSFQKHDYDATQCIPKFLFITILHKKKNVSTRVHYHSKRKPRRIPLFHSAQLVRVDIAFEALVAACDPLLAPPQA